MAKTKPDLLISELANGLSFELSEEKRPFVAQRILQNAIAKIGDRRLSEIPSRLSLQFSKETNPLIIQRSLQYAIDKALE
jgi:hypothetical protein